jgi:broad specificity phosphatase PhoE
MEKPTEKYLYVFRHGETDWNREGRLQGQTDTPLNDAGRAQAEFLVEKIEELELDIIVSSDLKRAFETAQIAASQARVKIVTSEALREINLGDIEGRKILEVKNEIDPSLWDKWRSVNHLDQRFPNGESKLEHLDRMKKYLDTVLGNVDYSNVGVSTHGGAVRRLVHCSIDSPKEPVPIPNCCIYKIIVKNGQWIYGGQE